MEPTQNTIPSLTERDTAIDIVNMIRDLLKRGATISAINPAGKILVHQGNGIWIGGFDIVFPASSPENNPQQYGNLHLRHNSR